MDMSLLTIKEKIEWLKTFLDYNNQVSKRSAELLFRATQLPRKTCWQDPYIINLLEIIDKQRVIYDESSDLYEITILKDISELSDKINTELKKYEINKEALEFNLRNKYEILELKKKNLIDANKNNNADKWLCATEIKSCLKVYLDEKEKLEVDIRLKLHENDQLYKEYRQSYIKIVNNFVRIQNSFYGRLQDTIDKNVLENILNNENNDVFYDFDVCIDENTNYKANITYEDECINLFNEIKNILEKENVKFNSLFGKILKGGIYRFKKGPQKDYRVCFIVLTDSYYLHVFDFERLLQNIPNIKVTFKTLINRLLKKHSTRLSIFFDNTKIETLNYNEETELIKFVDAILKESQFSNCLYKNISFKINEKIIKLDKEKYEIVIN
ncbi:hypothetical protein COBT_002464, partial [Conglomerata obtusa]